MPRMIALSVNSPIRNLLLQFKSLIAPNIRADFRIQCEKAFI